MHKTSSSMANVAWCEGHTHRFALHACCAELGNTLSNACFLLAAGIGLRRVRKRRLPSCFLHAELTLVVVGVSSALFHATLEPWAEICDEMSMAMLGTAYFFVLHRRHPWTSDVNTWRSLCLAYGLCVTTAWLLYLCRGWYEVFKICFTLQVVVPAGMSVSVAPPAAKRWWWAFVCCIGVGKMAWEMEQGLYGAGECPKAIGSVAWWLHPIWHACSAAAHACWMRCMAGLAEIKVHGA